VWAIALTISSIHKESKGAENEKFFQLPLLEDIAYIPSYSYRNIDGVYLYFRKHRGDVFPGDTAEAEQ
jgi:hypothetical protein